MADCKRQHIAEQWKIILTLDELFTVLRQFFSRKNKSMFNIIDDYVLCSMIMLSLWFYMGHAKKFPGIVEDKIQLAL